MRRLRTFASFTAAGHGGGELARAKMRGKDGADAGRSGGKGTGKGRGGRGGAEREDARCKEGEPCSCATSTSREFYTKKGPKAARSKAGGRRRQRRRSARARERWGAHGKSVQKKGGQAGRGRGRRGAARRLREAGRAISRQRGRGVARVSAPRVETACQRRVSTPRVDTACRHTRCCRGGCRAACHRAAARSAAGRRGRRDGLQCRGLRGGSPRRVDSAINFIGSAPPRRIPPPRGEQNALSNLHNTWRRRARPARRQPPRDKWSPKYTTAFTVLTVAALSPASFPRPAAGRARQASPRACRRARPPPRRAQTPRRP